MSRCRVRTRPVPCPSQQPGLGDIVTVYLDAVSQWQHHVCVWNWVPISCAGLKHYFRAPCLHETYSCACVFSFDQDPSLPLLMVFVPMSKARWKFVYQERSVSIGYLSSVLSQACLQAQLLGHPSLSTRVSAGKGN